MEDRYPDGLYLTFANFRDVTQDTDPPRMEPYLVHGVQPHQRVIRDEREWLARPDLWGVDVLPVSKSGLAEHHSVCWMADTVGNCPACVPLIQALWPRGSFDHAVLHTGEWREYELASREEQERVRRSIPRCPCGLNVDKLCRQHLRGVVSADEVQMKIWHTLRWQAIDPSPRPPEAEWQQFRQAAWEYGRNLALELCGPNPFRPVAFDPAWRTEHTVGIATKMYDDRDFAAMPILADALEEAGCDSEVILTHCREPGVHVRGCWVVDLVLGKV